MPYYLPPAAIKTVGIRPFTIAIAFIMSKNPHLRVWLVSVCLRTLWATLQL